MRTMSLIVTALTLLVFAGLSPALGPAFAKAADGSQTDWRVVKTFQIGGQGGWDYLIFDPTSRHVLVVSGRGKALMSFKPDIDPRNGKIDEPIALRGEPEFLAADAAGKVYINLMDTHEVAVVDLKGRKAVAHYLLQYSRPERTAGAHRRPAHS
jgi:hypothetical protein